MGPRYRVSLRFISQELGSGLDRWAEGAVTVEEKDFRSLRAARMKGPASYGYRLRELFFTGTEISRRLAEIRRTVDAKEENLRLRLFIGESASELHTLHW